MQDELSSDFIFDASTNRLVHLFSSKNRSDEVMEEMICLVQEKAPNLLDGLSSVLKEEILQSTIIRCYRMNQVIFRKGDLPDAYYTVIHGAVSLYSDNCPVFDGGLSNANYEDRQMYGKFLARLKAGCKSSRGNSDRFWTLDSNNN